MKSKKSKKFIPVFDPEIGKEELKNVTLALKSKEISGSFGSFLPKFEDEFAKYCQCQYGIAVNSGTSALDIAVMALGLKSGDEVLVSTFTNMATFFAVLRSGAKAIGIDVESDTLNIDPKLIESKITPKTKAIVIVHIYGHPCDMDPIMAIVKKHNLYLIEDCAEAHGALYKGKKIGSFGDLACFSFYANKVITTGEGGMITTNNPQLAEKCRSLRSLAFGKKNKFMHEDIGFGMRLTNLQAGIGLAQLKKIEKIIAKKKAIAKYYSSQLKNIKGIQLPVQKEYARNIYWMYCILVNEEFGISRDKLSEELFKKGIETRFAFVPFNQQEIFIKKGLTKENDCPIANNAGARGLYLPSSTLLSKKDMDYVISAIKEIKAEI